MTTVDERTETALRESIAKWEKNAAADVLPARAPGWRDCPLCALFAADETDDKDACAGCPVADAGHLSCGGTPYHDAYVAVTRQRSFQAFHEAAQREVDFLKSLLPETNP